MMQPLPEFDSIFRYIVVVSQRAEQIMTGARVRSETRHLKPTLQAVDDVEAGLVPWRILTQEELDAQRQAIVDQFRAEVGADRMQPEPRPPLRDVLPTRPIEAPEEQEELVPPERDEEIGRLQRLLGLGEHGRELPEDETSYRDDDEELALDLEGEVDLLDDGEPVKEEFVEEDEEGYVDDVGDGFVDASDDLVADED